MTTDERLDIVLELLQQMEQRLEELLETRPRREWYTVEEAAEILQRRPFTVREWCRLGRVNGDKRKTGRGSSREWRISHEELVRIQNEGLLPVDPANGNGKRHW